MNTIIGSNSSDPDQDRRVRFWLKIYMLGKQNTQPIVNGQCCLLADRVYILKAIKNATGTSVIFHINNSLIHFFFVLTSVPNVGERFAKT